MKKLITTIALSAMIFVSACSWTAVNYITQQAAQDVQTVASALPTIATALQTAGALTQAQVVIVQNDVAAVVAAAQALKMTPAVSSNDTNLQNFETAANGLLAMAAAVGSPPLPGSVEIGIVAAEVILPLTENVINSEVNVVVPAPATSAAAIPSPDQARNILKNLH